MSELVQLRQRMKAIETIKKITHAMRLISMSAHSRLKSKQEAVTLYMQELLSLLVNIVPRIQDWQHPFIASKNTSDNISLIILIGSQKGLCGNFNEALFQFFIRRMKKLQEQKVQYICVGKKAVDFCNQMDIYNVKQSYDNISLKTIQTIAKDVANFIIQHQQHIKSVTVYSNILKRFFLQQPFITTLVPFTFPEQQKLPAQNHFEDYLWQQQPQEIASMLINQYLEAHIQYLLFQSLLAEHAARFISMDAATQNAHNLLDTTKLQYNKLRQAKITKELTELVGSF
jgi:F-type H+-transporting ATPase subunit gamma